MSEVGVIGLDLAKHVFQVHGADGLGRMGWGGWVGADGLGRVVIRKRLRRGRVLEFFGRQPACVVALEACSGAHVRGRGIGRPGHEVRLIPPAQVKPFVKRQKNDAADAQASLARRRSGPPCGLWRPGAGTARPRR